MGPQHMKEAMEVMMGMPWVRLKMEGSAHGEPFVAKIRVRDGMYRTT
jgi:hypothetical protein